MGKVVSKGIDGKRVKIYEMLINLVLKHGSFHVHIYQEKIFTSFERMYIEIEPWIARTQISSNDFKNSLLNVIHVFEGTLFLC